MRVVRVRGGNGALQTRCGGAFAAQLYSFCGHPLSDLACFMTEETQSSSHSAWGDRIRALRNVPAVLRIMWDSGRSVVAWGLILRVIVPVLGLLIGIVAARIITGVARALEHQPQFPHFWWLV